MTLTRPNYEMLGTVTVRSPAELKSLNLAYSGANKRIVAAGDVIVDEKNGYAWEVAAEGAADAHLTTGDGWPVDLKVVDQPAIDLAAFGVLADSNGTTGNGTDNTAALQAAGAFLSGKSNIRITAPEGIVRFVGGASKKIFELVDSHGLTFDFGGTKFFDGHSYDFASGELAYFQHLTDCRNIELIVKEVESDVVTSGEGGLRCQYGVEQCHFITIKGKITGCSSAQHAVQSENNGESTRGSYFFADVICTNTDQPVNYNFSGDHSKAVVRMTGGGRPFFIDNARDIEVTMDAEDQDKAAGIAAWDNKGGRSGTENIRVKFHQRTGTSYPSALSLIDLAWKHTGTGGAEARDIDINFNIEPAPSGAGYGNLLHLVKYNTVTASYEDATANRGHICRNLKIGGYGDLTDTGVPVTKLSTSAFHASEICEGLEYSFYETTRPSPIKNVLLNFFDAADFNGKPPLIIGARFQRMYLDANWTAINTSARYELSSSTAPQTYINCLIGLVSTQDFTDKTLISTVLQTGDPVTRHFGETWARRLYFGENALGQGAAISSRVSRLDSEEIVVAAGAATVTTSINADAGLRSTLVMLSYKRDFESRIDTALRLFNATGNVGAVSDVAVATDDNTAGLIAGLALGVSGGALTVTSNFTYGGVLSVTVLR